jgi:uncharacterized protein (TIGR00297 family)
MTILSQGIPLLVALLIGVNGYRKKSLDLSGAIGAIIVGFLTLSTGVFETVVLLFFFYTCSKWTKFKQEIKKQREDGFKEGEGQRNWEQVLANGGFPTAVLLFDSLVTSSNSVPIFQVFAKTDDRIHLFLLSVYLGTYCANGGDTWSSELGILSKREPRFILAPWRRVPFGTNGGVSMNGFFAAFACGVSFGLLVISYIYAELLFKYIFDPSFNVHDYLTSPRYPILFLTIFAAMFGTLLDSILGALFEYSGFSKRKGVILNKYDKEEDFGDNLQHISGLNILTGCHVNYISGVVTGLLTGLIALYLY